MKELLNTGLSLELQYEESTDALIGQIKGYTTVIKENLSTGSYGCFFWVKEGDFSAITDIEEFLSDRKKLDPENVKKYRVTELGAAVALSRTDDDFVNATLLKRFIYDFTTNLSLNFYKNCCCECGKTENLALYNINGTAAQTCTECGSKYEFIHSFDGTVPKVMTPKAEEEKVSLPQEKAETPKEESAAVIPSVPEKTAHISEEEAFSNLFITDSTENITCDEEKEEHSDVTTEASFDSLLLGGEEEKVPEPPKSKIFEEAEREFAEEKARLAAEEGAKEPDNSIDEFLLTPSEPEEDIKSEDVTEYYKEKDIEGDYTIQEIKRTVDMPTITDGPLQLSAEETPLDENGKVPLINPMTNLEERSPSDPDGPNAVQPLEMTKNSEQLFSLPGYGTGDNMQRDGDAPPYNPSVVHSSSYNPKKGKSAPPPYNHNYSYSEVRPIKYIYKSNPIKGFFGSLFVGIIGVIVWMLICTMLDVTSYWGSLLAVAAAFGGYFLGGGVLDKKGIVISFLMAFIMTAAGMISIYAVELMNSGLEINFLEGVERFLQEISIETIRTVYEDFGISLAITLVVGIISSVALWRKT